MEEVQDIEKHIISSSSSCKQSSPDKHKWLTLAFFMKISRFKSQAGATLSLYSGLLPNTWTFPEFLLVSNLIAVIWSFFFFFKLPVTEHSKNLYELLQQLINFSAKHIFWIFLVSTSMCWILPYSTVTTLPLVLLSVFYTSIITKETLSYILLKNQK